MYESELNRSIESIATVPEEIRKKFVELRHRISHRTTLPWGEHCTECVWPTCYTTCELYSPREDGGCRQFVDGMVRVDHKDGLSPYLLKIQFKQWGKLWTGGNVHLHSLSTAEKRELVNIATGAVGRNLPLPTSIKPRVLRKINHLRKQSAENGVRNEEVPDYFLLECYNPNPRTITLTLTFRPGLRTEPRALHKRITICPGYTCAKTPFDEIAQCVETNRPFEIEIIPNDCADAVLYFGLLDFVKERPHEANNGKPAAKPAQLKCIVWDLDNTLWNGILIEDGADNIQIRQGVLDVIIETDKRGILHSISSKNNYEEAMRVLRRFGIDGYFLYPQILWQPKSKSIVQIAHLLNIGADTLAFVDDQQFEREEVRAVLPQVLTIDAADYSDIPKRPECQVPVTTESENRRLMYRQQEERKTANETYKGSYVEFLKDCRIEVGMHSLDNANLERVYELAQRTNQLNFSGNRYHKDQLAEIIESTLLETYVIDCADRFGNYGIVGFAVVDAREPRLLDLMFSCRIQGKRVEHAVLASLLNRFVVGKGQDFHANYRRTPKNAPGGKVFEDMGFERIGEDSGISSLVFRYGREIPDDRIFKIKMAGAELPVVSTSA